MQLPLSPLRLHQAMNRHCADEFTVLMERVRGHSDHELLAGIVTDDIEFHFRDNLTAQGAEKRIF